jgi:hypothetical protein
MDWYLGPEQIAARRLWQNQKAALYRVTQDPRPHHAGHALGGHEMELDDLATGELGAVVLGAEAPGAAVEQFGAHFSATAVRHSGAELKTDLASGCPPWLASLLGVLAGPGP